MIFIKQVVVRYHTNISLIKSYHIVTHVIIFLSYTTTPGIIETLSIPITPIYIIQAHTVTFSLYFHKLLSAWYVISNAQCTVWHAVAIIQCLNKWIGRAANSLIITWRCMLTSYHTHRITLIVSHSSYRTPTLLPVEYDEYWIFCGRSPPSHTTHPDPSGWKIEWA